MAAIPYPLVNGVRHSWSSVELRVAGQIILGCTEINYSPSLEPAVVRGAGALPIGFTLGNADYDCDMSMLLAEFDQLMQALGSQAMVNTFDIVVSYDPTLGGVTDGGLPVITDEIIACRITKIENTTNSGTTDPNVRKLTIKPLRLFLNGIDVMPAQPTVAS